MRLNRFRLFLLGGGALLLLGPAVGLGQFQGGPPGGFQPPPGGFQPGDSPGPGGPGGRRGMFRMDPSMIFNMMTNNQDFLTEAQYLANPFVARDPNAKDRIESFMQRMGITNGGLTRDQFSQFFQERMAQRQAERAAANPGGQNPSDPNAPAPAADPNAATDPDAEPPPPEDKRPTVYRVGSLPPGLPAWFATYDTDQDGQVGLYEWKAQGGSVSDFQKIDLNGDGFITVDEALRYQKTQGGTAVAANGPSYPGAPSFSGQPSFNGQPPNGFNGGRFGNRGNRGNRGNFGN